MADEFMLDAAALQNVADGLHDIESRMAAVVSTLRSQLAAEGTPWQFSGAPPGIATQLEKVQDSVDPTKSGSIGAAVGGQNGLAAYLDQVVDIVTKADNDLTTAASSGNPNAPAYEAQVTSYLDNIVNPAGPGG